MARTIEMLILCMRDGQGVTVQPDTVVTDIEGQRIEFGRIPVAVRLRKTLWLFVEEDQITLGGEDEEELRDCLTDIRVEDIIRIHRVWSHPALEVWREGDAEAA